MVDSLTLFFPMYNERESIETFMAHIDEEVPKLGLKDCEILIVDDGSQDGCDRQVVEWAKRNPQVRMVQHNENQGYGVALHTGFTQGNKAAVFYTDIDLPAQIADVKRALPLLAEADLVIGYRIKRYETLRRAVFSKIYNILMRLMFGVRVRDVNFSFKLVRRQVLDCVRLSATTVFIDGELLAEAQRCGFSIAEIPIEYTPRQFGASNFDRFSTAWATLVEMFAYWMRRNG